MNSDRCTGVPDRNPWRGFGAVAAAALVVVSASPGAESISPQIPAASERVGKCGRFQPGEEPGTLLAAWSGSALRVRFEGPRIEVLLRDRATGVEGNAFAVVVDDGDPWALFLQRGKTRYVLADDLPEGEHTLLLLKRTEAGVGAVEFVGFDLPGGRILVPPPPAPRRIELIGDSITCGYGNEAPGPEEHYRPSTENNYMSYGQIAARILGAECHVIAWSGEGICQNGFGEVLRPLPTIYDRVLPRDPESRWDFGKWVPHVVVINLGTNDFSGGGLEEDRFVGAYVPFVRRIAGLYPGVRIFCCLGPMLTDAWPPGEGRLSTARRWIRRAVAECREAGVEHVEFLEFETLKKGEYGADWHPNIAAHERMAATLVEAVSAATGWKPVRSGREPARTGDPVVPARDLPLSAADSRGGGDGTAGRIR